MLAFDELAELDRGDKFAPRWRGPYKLSLHISWHLWKMEEVAEGRRKGRTAELVFHVDQLQPFIPI